MSLSISDTGSNTVKVVSEKHIIWNKRDDNTGSRCPTILPFAISFPSTYKDCGERMRKLPPTYQVVCFGFPSTLCATCSYTLIITVTRVPILAFWPASTTYASSFFFSFPRHRLIAHAMADIPFHWSTALVSPLRD